MALIVMEPVPHHDGRSAGVSGASGSSVSGASGSSDVSDASGSPSVRVIFTESLVPVCGESMVPPRSRRARS